MKSQNDLRRRAVLIAGPTASGKSALALKIAQGCDGLIVNADSMQVYEILRVLSARPGEQDLARAPHALYGFVAPSVRFSTGEYIRHVARLLAEEAEDRTLIFVGGTGLYFDALINGFMSVPEIPSELVDELNDAVADMDRAQRFDLLHEKDPALAEQLTEVDPQRLVRALSVLEHTNKRLSDWQEDQAPGILADYDLEKIVVAPDAQVSAKRIAARFANMFESGAVEEVKALLALDLDPSLPAMKAIGVKQITQFLEGELSQDEAIESAIIATRQYAKRQRTWMRNRMGDWAWRESAVEAD